MCIHPSIAGMLPGWDEATCPHVFLDGVWQLCSCLSTVVVHQGMGRSFYLRLGIFCLRLVFVAYGQFGLVLFYFQERKSSPMRRFLGRISHARPRGYPGGRPGAKASVRPSESWKKNKHFGADVHDPNARTSMTLGLFC